MRPNIEHRCSQIQVSECSKVAGSKPRSLFVVDGKRYCRLHRPETPNNCSHTLRLSTGANGWFSDPCPWCGVTG